ncbi:MAG: RagB/SusD family nutrient uptake outer membrane protein [Flavobacteriaceae bacterium]|nr:RagB/SusD family nutrient uptake outer membrane protein [Flavobacteriaceae bacterium]MDZ4148208.1 RagB/SusD family nutrient uptake outer membrane protein [Flavobacteriaceae bacterium]
MNKYIAVTFLGLALSACSDNFVQEDPAFVIDSESFFNSESDFQEALIGSYDLLQATYVNVMIGEMASDNTLAGGESAVDVPGFQEIDDMTQTPVNQQLRDLWNWMYAGINRTNFMMEFKDKVDFPNKNQILAQNRFLRAYYYFELVKFFGDVPLSEDKRIQFGQETSIDRAPKSEVYNLIERDLRFAADNLPYTQAQKGRITKGAALALLGKALLFQNKFGEASTVLEEVINDGPYDLVTDYNSIFESVGENNIESVFEIQYSDLEGAGFGCLQCSEGNVAVGFNGIRNYSGPLFDSGFSFNVPTQEAYDAYNPADIRRDVAILNINTWAEQTGATFVEGFEHTGFYNRKYIARQGDLNTGDANLTNPNNYRSIRFADVLLMAAEAFNRSGSGDEKARLYLNRVRQRAELSDLSLSGSALTQAIWDERRLELMGEGHRFFDLVRTGQAAEKITGFSAGKNELFPIPSIEIELAGNRWPQNPGY